MKNTTDIWFASFLKIKGYELTNFEVISRGKGRFIFNISEEDYKKEKLEFFKSELSEYKQKMEELKDLLW